MRQRLLALVLGLLALACSGEERHRARSTEPSPSEPHSTAPEVETLPPSRTVRFVTEDGVTIEGTLQPAAHADAPAVVLVHQLASDRSEWAPLLEALHAQPSLTTLAIDMRGHGGSTAGPSGTLDWHAFDADGWAGTRLDVRAALAFLRSAESGVTPSSFAAIGSSIGSSAVVAGAAEEPSLTTIVTLSPGRAYHGFDAITPAATLGDRHILAAVARDETESVDTAQAFGRIGHLPAVVIDGDAHGVALFGADPTLVGRIDGFVREHLGVAAEADPTSPDEPSHSASEAPRPD